MAIKKLATINRKGSELMNITTDTYTTQAHFNALSSNAQAKAAKFKELTGKEIVIEKNDNGDFIHMFNPESTQRLSFFGEFFRVGFSSPDGFEAAIENLARKYAEKREELIERYVDNQDELYRQLGELNQAFESALRSTTLLPQSPMPASSGFVSGNMPQSVREAIKHEWQEYDNIQAFMRTLQQSMARHLDAFFETFIKNVQSADFDTVFAGSMETLMASESRSLSDMSFRDTSLIRDALFQGRFERDEYDNEVFIVQSPATSLRQVVSNLSISSVIRRELADLLGLIIQS